MLENILYMKKNTILTAAFIFSTSFAFSQISTWPLEVSLQVGGQTNSSSNLNRLMKEAGIKKYPSAAFNVGLSAGYQFKHLILGAGVGSATNFGKNEWESTNIYLYISTNSIQSHNFIFTPQINIGGQTTTITMMKKNMNGNFEDYLTTLSNQTKIEHETPVIDFSFTLKKKRNGFNNPLFRVGYRTSLAQSKWKVIGSSTSNEPSDKTSNIYAQLVFGIGKNK